MRLKHIKNAEEIISKSKYLVKSPRENKGSWNKVFNNDTCFHFTRSVNLYNIEINGLTSVPEKRENMTKTDEGHDTIYFSKGIIGLRSTLNT